MAKKEIICQFKLNGDFVKEWKSAGQINLATGFDKSAVLKVCKGQNEKAYWFKWKFKKDLSPKELELINKSQVVLGQQQF